MKQIVKFLLKLETIYLRIFFQIISLVRFDNAIFKANLRIDNGQLVVLLAKTDFIVAVFVRQEARLSEVQIMALKSIN